MNAPTPHNAAKLGEIAKTVIVCGDPKRVMNIAERYLEEAKLVSDVRHACCYTGLYKNKPLTVMAHGMGVPSIGIYVTELYSVYGVETIIRAGSAGAFTDEIELMDVILAMSACTDSNFISQYNLPGTFAPAADYKLLKTADEEASRLGIPVHIGGVLTTDVFYATDEFNKSWRDVGVLGVDMETSALYTLAAKYKRKALAILTASDHLFKNQRLTIEQRENSFDRMITLALETAYRADSI